MSNTGLTTRRAALAELAALAAAPALGGLIVPGAAMAQRPKLDVPYVPTPQEVVDRMLELAKIKPDDYLIDLGSGDGRIAITAAKKYGIKAYGIDIDPDRIKEARENAQKAGVADKVTFEQGDLFKADISKASVLTLYLYQSVNDRLRPVILKTLKPGSRVVSHAFDMGDWKPEVHERVDGRNIYMWTVPAGGDISGAKK